MEDIRYIQHDDIPNIKHKFSSDINPHKKSSDIDAWLTAQGKVVKSFQFGDDWPEENGIFFIDINIVSRLHTDACNEIPDSTKTLSKLSALVNNPNNKTIFFGLNTTDAPDSQPPLPNTQSFITYITHHIVQSKYQTLTGGEDATTVYFMVGFPDEERVLIKGLDTHENILCRVGWFKEPMVHHIFNKEQEWYKETIHPTKRFSIFSRRIDDERQHFFFELVRNNIIENCYYSFGDSHPDFVGENDYTRTKDQIKEAVIPTRTSNLFFLTAKDEDQKIYDWIDGIPYTVGDYENIHDPLITEYTKSSSIHIAIETCTAPAYILLTEKVGRPIAMKKPFLVFGQPYIMAYLQKCGFRTFHPIINETYDSVIDPYERQQMIINELDRFNLMSDEEFANEMEELNDIVEENYARMLELSELKLTPTFYRLGIFNGPVVF